MKYNLTLLSVVLLSISCFKPGSFQLVNVENRYSIEVPSLLVKATDLNPEASLQYQNRISAFYVIIMEENKKEVYDLLKGSNYFSVDFNGFTQMYLDHSVKSLSLKNNSGTRDTLINGLNAKLTHFEGVFEDIEMFYYVGLIEGKETLYEILSWTSFDKKNDYLKDIEKMVNSFKEL